MPLVFPGISPIFIFGGVCAVFDMLDGGETMALRVRTRIDDRLTNFADEIQWVIFRLFGVHSSLRMPGTPESGGAWSFHRPWFCFFIHEAASQAGRGHPLRGLDSACRRRLAGLWRGKSRRAIGRCGAGLRYFRIRSGDAGQKGFRILLGPYLSRHPGEKWFRDFARRTRYPDSMKLHWGFRGMPVIGPRMERVMAATVRNLLDSLASRFSGLRRGLAWDNVIGSTVESVYPPLHTGDDIPANIYAVFVQFHEGEPPVRPSSGRTGMYELDFIRQGRARVHSGGRSFELAAGSGCLTLPGHVLRIRRAGESPLSSIAISFTGMAPFCAGLAGKPLAFNARQQELLGDLISAAGPQRDVTHRSSRVKILLLLLLLQLEDASPARGTVKVIPTFERNRRRYLANRIRDFIEEHREENIGPAEMAAAAGVSVTTMYRMFVREIGTSPVKYLTRQRIERAAQLLRESNMNVSMAALRLHFSNPFHFSRVFKRIVGVSPSEHAAAVRFRTEPDLAAPDNGGARKQ